MKITFVAFTKTFSSLFKDCKVISFSCMQINDLANTSIERASR